MNESVYRATAGMEPALPAPSISPDIPFASSIESAAAEFFEWFGELGIFFSRVVRAAVTPPFEFRELVRQLDEWLLRIQTYKTSQLKVNSAEIFVRLLLLKKVFHFCHWIIPKWNFVLQLFFQKIKN